MEKNQSKTLPQFGNYETLEWLGSGGGANTYLVEDTALLRYWVVKQIKREFVSQDPKFEERFRQEAQMLASLNHPHIVKIHEFDTQQGYIVMPWAEGGTLRKLLDDEYPNGMTPKEALPILQQIGAGLSYAHEQPNPTNGQQRGILHLDLKPENILVEVRSGSKGKKDLHYLVADFGIARWMSKTTGSPEGQSWFGVGTRGYRAPEQYIVGRDEPTVKSDVYSLGIITHEMLSGQRPPKEPGKALRPLRELNSAISSEVEAVVQKATKDDSSERYPSVKGFLKALEQAIEKPAIGSFSSTTTVLPNPSGPSWVKKIVGSPYYSLVATLVILGFVAWVLVQSLPATHFTRLGGVELGPYCTSLGYHENIADVSCSSTINLNAACNWQFETTGLHFHLQNSSDPTSGNCYDSHGNTVGGIRNMDDYCKDPRQDYLGMPGAMAVGNTWVCEQKIDVTQICIWQYSRTDVLARKNDQGLWECYGLF